MTLKFGTTEIPNTATVNYVDGNGSHPVSAIVYNGTTVWQAGPGLSTELELSKTPFLFHFDNNYWKWQNSGNIQPEDMLKANFDNISLSSYPVPKFNSYANGTWYRTSPFSLFFGGMTISPLDNFTIEGWVYPSVNGYYGNNCANYYAGLVFADSQGTPTGAATTAIWRMYVKCTTDLYHAVLVVTDDNSVNYTSSEFVSADGWYHLAAVHKGSGAFDFFVNGQKLTTQTISFTSSTGFNFLCQAHGPVDGGDMASFDEVVVHSYARYTGNFTPPTAAYTVV